MKKKIYLLSTILLSAAVLSLSSCLKDQAHYVDFSKGGNYVDFPLGGYVNFSKDAITESPDTDAKGTIVREFAVNVATATLPTTPTTVTLAVGDASDVSALNTLQSTVTYELMPSNAYTFTSTKVTIPAGKQYVNTTVTFYKNLLDPSKSYVLPIKITDGGGQKLSTNLNIHYYHFIGNDFAGVYNSDFHRFNAVDTLSNFVPSQSYDSEPTTIYPVTPTQFEVYSGYAGGIFRYEVTFTKNGLGSSATYTNFSIFMNADDLAAYSPSPNFINIANKPVFQPSGSKTLEGPYTFAQALKLLNFSFSVTSGAANAPRSLTDRYYK